MSTGTPTGARAHPESWGRLVESAVGAHLVNTAGRDLKVTWWRERGREVDFILSGPAGVLAIEVASGRVKPSLPGLAAFSRVVPSARTSSWGRRGYRSRRSCRDRPPTCSCDPFARRQGPTRRPQRFLLLWRYGSIGSAPTRIARARPPTAGAPLDAHQRSTGGPSWHSPPTGRPCRHRRPRRRTRWMAVGHRLRRRARDWTGIMAMRQGPPRRRLPEFRRERQTE